MIQEQSRKFQIRKYMDFAQALGGIEVSTREGRVGYVVPVSSELVMGPYITQSRSTR